jgi:signal transduction histidine kinase
LAEARALRAERAVDGDPEFVIAAATLAEGHATDLLAGEIPPPLPLLVLLDAWDPVRSRAALDQGALDVLVPADLQPSILERALARARRAWRSDDALRRTQAELQEERGRLELVSRNLGVALVTISRDYRTLWANSVVTDTFGDVVGRPCYEAYQGRTTICSDCGARRVFEEGATRVVCEQRHVDRQGKPVWFEIVAAPVALEDGSPQAVMELGLPADARKRAEQALRESEARYRALSQEFQAILDAIPDTLVQLAPDLTVQWANRGAARGVGRTLENLVGRRCHELWHCRPAPCDACPVQACLRSGRTEELCVVTPDDRAWDLRAVPVLDESGVARGAVEVARDVTEQRRAEREREALLRDLSGKNALLEQFTQTVSHDLKGPLTTIRGFAALLDRELDAERDERAKAHARHIGTAAERMKELLEALRDFSRAGEGGRREPVPLGHVAQEALDAYALQIAERGVHVVVAPDLPTVQGDWVRLREVLENLVANAVKFLGDQSSPRIEIGHRTDSHGTVVFVRDNGVGIDPRHQQQIFGMFEKLNPRTEGSGVGLAIVRRIVEAHGGAVWVESAGLGKGSTFCFTLGETTPRPKTTP